MRRSIARIHPPQLVFPAIAHSEQTWAQCYKTLQGCNLRMPAINQSVCLSNLVQCLQVRLQPTQVNHLSNEPLQGRLLALPTNIKLGQKGLTGTNTLTYYNKFVNKKCKKSYNIGARPQYTKIKFFSLQQLQRHSKLERLPLTSIFQSSLTLEGEVSNPPLECTICIVLRLGTRLYNPQILEQAEKPFQCQNSDRELQPKKFYMIDF